MKVYQAIAAAMAEIAKEGIGKNRKNDQQGYKFRGIDDVYNALAPILSKCGLVMLPRVLNREVVERTTARGNAIFYVTVDVEFDLVCAEDGSKHTVKTFGEAMDTADKATNKAMSAAYKYMAMEVFCIPTEGDNDADSTTHEVAPKNTPTQIMRDEFESLTAEQQKFFMAVAEKTRAQLDSGNVDEGYRIYSEFRDTLEDTAHQAALRSLFSSAEKSAMMKYHNKLQALKKEAA